MNRLELALMELRRRGLGVRLRDGKLVAFPDHAITATLRLAIAGNRELLVEHVRGHQGELPPPDPMEWRVEAFRQQLPPDTRAIPFLVARPDLQLTRGRCASCGDAIPGVTAGRCSWCSAALREVLRDWRPDRTPQASCVTPADWEDRL